MREPSIEQPISLSLSLSSSSSPSPDSLSLSFHLSAMTEQNPSVTQASELNLEFSEDHSVRELLVGSEMVETSNDQSVPESLQGSEIVGILNDRVLADSLDGSGMVTSSDDQNLPGFLEGFEIVGTSNDKVLSGFLEGSEVVTSNGHFAPDSLEGSECVTTSYDQVVPDSLQGSGIVESLEGFAMAETSREQSVSESSDGSTMAETSREQSVAESLDRSAMDATSVNDTSGTSYSFRFQIHPASKLKHALEVLSDDDFNPQGSGLIKVGPNGVEIKALNIETRVLCCLEMGASGFVNFSYNEPFNKMVDLNKICNDLNLCDDGSVINIQHAYGSDELTFTFGESCPREFAVELAEMNDDFEKVPLITHTYESVINCEALREIINHVEASTSKAVFFNIADGIMSIKIEDQEWTCDYEKKVSARVIKPWQKHRARFPWLHYKSLRKASYLDRRVLLCLITDPPHCMMLRFSFHDLGHLAFVKGAAVIQPSVVPGMKEKPTHSFSLQLYPASILTNALNVLSYLCFKRHDSGIITVNPSEMEIVTGLNEGMKIIGGLSLTDIGSISFNCYKPINMKIVNLTDLFLDVSVAHYDDMIEIHHVDESDELQIVLGKVLPKRIGVKLHDKSSHFGDIPRVGFAISIIIPSDDLRQIIQHVEASISKSVSFHVANMNVSIKAERKVWNYEYNYTDPQAAGNDYHVGFEMLMPRYPHCVSLKEASWLADWCFVGLVTIPLNCVVLRFNIAKQIHMMFVMGANLKLPKFRSLENSPEPSEQDSEALKDRSIAELSNSVSKDELSSKKSMEPSTGQHDTPPNPSKTKLLKGPVKTRHTTKNRKPSKHPKPNRFSFPAEPEPGEQRRSYGIDDDNKTDPTMDNPLNENPEPLNQDQLPKIHTSETSTDPSIVISPKENGPAAAEPSEEDSESQIQNPEALQLPLTETSGDNSKDFVVGSILAIKTTLGEEFEGRVITFDRPFNILLLQEGSESGPNKKNIRLLNTNYIEESTLLHQSEDPLDLKTFNLEALSKTKLKEAIEALRDANFNEQGKGVIEVGPEGLQITVSNIGSKVVAYLHLKATGFITFNYQKIVDLNQIAQSLSVASENDSVAIHHVHGSNELSFMFGKRPSRKFPVELHEINGKFEKVPDITYACEASVPSGVLRRIIEEVEATATKNVRFSISKGNLAVNDKKVWTFKSAIKDSRAKLRKRHNTSFKWLHCESLGKASAVAEKAVLCLTMEPPKCMMMCFHIRDQGDLVYIMGHNLILPKFALDKQTGSFGAEESIVEPGEQSSSSGTGEQNSKP